jgi:Zn-finger nucleic acid-binding protein
MNCPGCDAEPLDADAGEELPRICASCGGLWMNGSDLNRLLLHNGLPGIESVGGRRVKGADVAACRSCGVDLIRFEGGSREAPDFYELCEDCGCVFIDGDSAPTGDAEAAQRGLVTFFRRFAAEKANAKR